MIVKAKDGQCLLDIALMVTGITEGVWALAERNGLSVTSDIVYGTEIVWEVDDVVDWRVAERYVRDGICPATDVSDKTLAELLNVPVEEDVPSYSGIVADDVMPQTTRASVFSDEFTSAFS